MHQSEYLGRSYLDKLDLNFSPQEYRDRICQAECLEQFLGNWIASLLGFSQDQDTPDAQDPQYLTKKNLQKLLQSGKKIELILSTPERYLLEYRFDNNGGQLFIFRSNQFDGEIYISAKEVLQHSYSTHHLTEAQFFWRQFNSEEIVILHQMLKKLLDSASFRIT